MKHIKYIILCLMLIFSISIPSYAKEEEIKESTYITAEDLVFTADEVEPKMINFDTDIHYTKFAISYPNNGVVSITQTGEVTPLSIGEVEVELFDIDKPEIKTTIKISVWMDKLPDPPSYNVTIKNMTFDSITLQNDCKNIPENVKFQYSLNGIVWQDSETFSGLKDNTTYSIYVRGRALYDDKWYTILGSSEDPYLTVTTAIKPDEPTEPIIKEIILGSLVYKEGIIYQIDFGTQEVMEYKSTDKTVATVDNTGKITCKAPGEAQIIIVVDGSTDTTEKYYHYIYNLTVVEKLRVKCTITTSYEKVYVSVDQSNNPDKFTPKFSFDKNKWTDSTTLTRSSKTPENKIYAVYMDSNGYYRSSIEEFDLNTNIVENKITNDPVNKTIKVGDSLDFTDGSYNKSYLITIENGSIVKESSSGVITGVNAGQSVVKVLTKVFNFDSKGNYTRTVINDTYNITVTASNIPTPTPTDNPTDISSDKPSDNLSDDPTITPTDTPTTPIVKPTDKPSIYVDDDDKLTLAIPVVLTRNRTLTYNGKSQLPDFTVTLNNKTVKSKYYTVTTSPKTHKNVGTYKMTVSFTPDSGYTGSTTITYNIIPKKTTGLKVKQTSKNKVKISWKKGSPNITGYKITVISPYNKIKTYTVKGRNKLSKTIKVPKGYTVKVRSYKVVSGTTLYGKYSKSVKVK